MRIFPLAVGFLAAAVFSGSVINGFTFDDPHIVVENPLVTGDGGLVKIFTSHYWAGEDARSALYRPLTVATYWINWRLAGMSPFSYHLVNIVLHGAVTGIFFLLLKRLAGSPAPACAAAILFATHPVHTEAVASIVGRAELLAALFVGLAWLWRDRTGPALSLFACGMLAKENAVILPVLLAVEDLLSARSLRWRRYVPFVAAAGGFLLLRWQVVGPVIGALEGPFVHEPTVHRLLTAIAVLGRYVWLMIFPVTLSADYSFDQIPVVTTPLDPGFLAGAAVMLLGWLLVRGGWRRWPAVAMGVLVFFIALLPVSNLLFGIGVMMAERLLYLPSLGLCLAAGAAMASGLLAMGTRRLVAATCLVALAPATVLTLRSVVRTWDWFDQLSLFEATVRTSPNSALAHVNLGSIYQAMGRLVEAEASYRRAIAIAPDRPGPYYNLATVLEKTGRPEEAIIEYREALRLDPGNVRALNNLGKALLARRRVREAIAMLSRAVTIAPEAPKPAVNLAAAYLQAGDLDRAGRLARQVLASRPEDEAARRVLAEVERRAATAR
ncbi:MAG: tetratricopeptide repeat protein [Acidobacteriota bacterium]